MAIDPITDHVVHFEPAHAISRLPAESTHLVVTSPPYPMIEMWDKVFGDQDTGIATALLANPPEQAFGLMHGLLEEVWREVFRVVCPGGIVCINIGDAARTLDGCFRLYPNHARIIERCIELGFHNLPNIIWRKPTNAPTKFMGSGMLPPGAYVTLEHEYILVFRKGNKRDLHIETDKRRRAESAYFWEERNRWFSDVWLDLTGIGQALPDASRSRSAAFPLEMAWRLINMFSIKGDTVLDPFLGTGTTMLAAAVSERNSVGYEIDRSLAPAIESQLRSASQLSKRLVTDRINCHLAFMREREGKGRKAAYHLLHHGLPCVSRQETGMRLRVVEGITMSRPGSFTAAYRDYCGDDQGELLFL